MDKGNLPVVSVVCLCYNHSKYVIESINSVLDQSYPNVELVIVDDASTDESNAVIKNFLIDHPGIKFISLETNVGNCAAFNKGWHASSGEYIIDLAADDLLLPDRISIGVEKFLDSGPDYGVHFGDARIINKEGQIIREHKTEDLNEEKILDGYLFKELLSKYFINPATMMYSNALLHYIGGYDESLAYEDFDLWIRSSQKFKFCYSNEFLVAKRLLKKSHGKSQYRPGSKMLKSTYIVCEKAFDRCDNSEEYKALLIRIKYEMKMAFFSLNWPVAFSFYRLKRKVVVKISDQEF